MNCSNNLKQVGLAARTWALNHNDALPPDFASMKVELGDERVAFCPTDHKTCYEILSPSVDDSDATVVYAKCPIHENILLVNGNIENLGKSKLARDNGKWKVNLTAPPEGKT